MSALDTALSPWKFALLSSRGAQPARRSPAPIPHTAVIAFAGKPPNHP